LSVKAKDKATNKEQSIRIEASSGLADADIERMRKEAEANADTDKQKVELVEARNMADQAVYAARKALGDNKDKIPMELATAINEKIAAVENKKGSDDSAAIKSATTELTTELSKVYEAIQKQTPPKDTPPGTQSAPSDNPQQKQ